MSMGDRKRAGEQENESERERDILKTHARAHRRHFNLNR